MSVLAVETGIKPEFTDAAGNSIARELRSQGFDVKKVRVHEVYTIDANLKEKEKEKVKEAFFDPVVQELAAEKDFDVVIEVGFKPGVTDNVGRSVWAEHW